MLVKVKGTPLADNDDVDAFDFIRTIAVARIMIPNLLRAPFCRTRADEQTSSGDVLYGRRKLDFLRLQTANHAESGRRDKDLQLFRKLGLNPQQTAVLAGDNEQQQRLEQALMTPDTDRSTTRQHYRLAGENQRGARCAACCRCPASPLSSGARSRTLAGGG